MENRTARLTILVDPRKKKLFEDICARQDLNASQVVRKLLRQYIVEHMPAEELPQWLSATPRTSGASADQKPESD